MNRIEGKVCVVTGAASGLGLAAAQRLVEEGGRVLLTDINASAVAECAELLGANAGAMTLDVRNRDQWRAVIDAAVDRWGRLDVMVNNAGVARPGTIESVTDDDWDTVLGINLYGVMLGTQFAIGQMKRNGGGSIINIASVRGFLGEPVSMAYSASKGGVRIMSKSAAKHCAAQGYNIRVNCVCPSFVDTPLITGAMAKLSAEKADEFQRKVLSAIPMKRFGTAAEIANGVVFLASDEASFMTGSDVMMDGGHTA